MRRRWLNRTFARLRINNGVVIGGTLIVLGTQLESDDVEWAFVPGGSGVILLLVTLGSAIADGVDHRKEHRDG